MSELASSERPGMMSGSFTVPAAVPSERQSWTMFPLASVPRK